MFFGCILQPDSKEIELGNSNQEASLLVGKNMEISFNAMLRMEGCPFKYFQWCEYSRGPWVPLVATAESSLMVTKIMERNGVMNSQLSLLILTTL